MTRPRSGAVDDRKRRQEPCSGSGDAGQDGSPQRSTHERRQRSSARSSMGASRRNGRFGGWPAQPQACGSMEGSRVTRSPDSRPRARRQHPTRPHDGCAGLPGPAHYAELRRSVRPAHLEPCQIEGAGTVRHGERGTASPTEIYVIAAAMPTRCRAAVILAAWSGIRRGELLGLARRHLKL